MSELRFRFRKAAFAGILKKCLFFCLCINLTACSACIGVLNTGQRGSLTYLKSEFEQIHSLPKSIAGPQHSQDKGRQGHIATSYNSDESRETIKAHYDAELLKRGWKFCKREKVLYNGRDYGGEHIFYHKDIYTADLQFAGEQQSRFGWKYSFSLSWGLYDIECSQLTP